MEGRLVWNLLPYLKGTAGLPTVQGDVATPPSADERCPVKTRRKSEEIESEVNKEG